VAASVEKLPFTTYREYFDDSYKVRLINLNRLVRINR